MILCRRRINPFRFSLIALFIAIIGLPILYSVAVYNEHINAFFPFISSFGVFPPEKYGFFVMMTTYSIFNTAGNWFWFQIVKTKISNMSKSLIPLFINSIIRLLMTISGLCLTGLSIFDMEEYNWHHYLMTVCNFFCHGLSITLGGCLMLKYFEDSHWFWCIRFTMTVEMIFSAIAFVYFNFTGLPRLDTLNIYRMLPTDGGYWEFVYCAMAEWVMVATCIVYTLVIALETNKYGKSLMRTVSRDTSTVQLLRNV
uniref:CWH43-like N-terminal domain-containing protein n=1 Tax=Trichobilharzia regenti TaxID=157069 RepID=A0AA85JVW4_TRIRE|nr:unnamed protein product [Trichobilharzia regenti]